MDGPLCLTILKQSYLFSEYLEMYPWRRRAPEDDWDDQPRVSGLRGHIKSYLYFWGMFPRNYMQNFICKLDPETQNT